MNEESINQIMDSIQDLKGKVARMGDAAFWVFSDLCDIENKLRKERNENNAQ